MPPPSPISHLAVIGSGQMGLGIAYVSSVVAKVAVSLCDTSPSQLTKGLSFFDALLEKDVEKGKLTREEADEARKRISVVEGIEKLASTGAAAPTSSSSSSSPSPSTPPQLVIEAATESLPVKQAIFRSLATHLPLETILATNTSSISVTKIAAAAGNVQGREEDEEFKKQSPKRVLGLHFMNPVPVLKLCEVIPSLQTSDETLQLSRSFALSCGKTLVQSLDTPGFIANRLLMPYINEAIIALSEGVATKEDIDATMTLGMAHPMGPLRLADHIGLDTCLAIMKQLAEETGDSKYRPSTLLGRMVDAAWLGKKSGKGFYEY